MDDNSSQAQHDNTQINYTPLEISRKELSIGV